MNIKEFSDKLFSKGKELGFEEMEVYYVDSDSFEIKVYEEDIDSYNVNTSRGLSFRGLINGKMGYSFTEKFSNEDIEYLIKSAKENLEEVEIKGEEFIFEGSEKYHEAFKSKYKEIETAKKIQDAIELEKLGYKNSKIDSVQNCILETAKGTRRIINTKGVDLVDFSGVCVAYISVVAKDGEDVKSGSSFKIVESYDNINFNDMANEAIDEAVSKLGAKPIPTGKYKAILRYDVAADMLSTFASVFSAESVHKGLSLLKDKLNESIASSKITIIDNPFLDEASTKCTFDDEGVATYKKIIVENGVLKTYLHNLKTSKKDGVKSTGNGFKGSYKSSVDIGPTNMYIEKGEKSIDEIIKDSDNTLLITELQGLHSGANSVTGDFSLAAVGKLIKNGKIEGSVEQITVSGNFYDMLKEVEEVASDFKLTSPSVAGAYGSPSIVIKEMSISGK